MVASPIGLRTTRRTALLTQAFVRPEAVATSVAHPLYSQPRCFSRDSGKSGTHDRGPHTWWAGLHPRNRSTHRAIAVWREICHRSHRRGRPPSLRQLGSGYEHHSSSIPGSPGGVRHRLARERTAAEQSAEAVGHALQPRERPRSTRIVVASRAAAA